MCSELPSNLIQVISQEISDEIYKKLMCSHCKNYCHPPLRQCRYGRLMCVVCYKRNGLCTLCSTAISSARPFILEKMYLKLEFDCKYHLQGCVFHGTGKSLMEHHKNCVHMSTLCRYDDCEWIGMPRNIFGHYRIHHPHSLKKDKSNYKQIVEVHRTAEYLYMMNLIMIYGRVFYVMLVINRSEKYFGYMATNMEPFEIEKFDLLIEFKLDGGRRHTETLRVLPSDNNMKEDGLERHEAELSYEDSSQNYNIYIKKKRSTSYLHKACPFIVVLHVILFFILFKTAN